MGGIWLGRSRALQQGAKHQPPPLTLRGTFRFCKMILFAVITTFPWSKQSIHNVAFSCFAAKVSLRQVMGFSWTHSCQVVQKKAPSVRQGDMAHVSKQRRDRWKSFSRPLACPWHTPAASGGSNPFLEGPCLVAREESLCQTICCQALCLHVHPVSFFCF